MTHQSPSYTITMRLRYPDRSWQLGMITSAIGQADGMIGAVDIVDVRKDVITRDITVKARGVEHVEKIVEQVRSLEGVEVVSVSDRTFLLHLGGKIEVNSKVPIKTRDDLSMAYTPGVARVCQRIHEDPDAAFALTRSDPDLAAPHAAVLATGRSDYANQINNVLCFPGFFRGMLDVRACRVTDSMKTAAATAIAGVVPDAELLADYIIPSVFDRRVASAVAEAVSKAAMDDGVARREQKSGVRMSP